MLETIKVELNKTIYEMDQKTFNKYISGTRETLSDRSMIFCILKNNFAMMLREYHSKKSLKKAVAKYRTEGFKVYYNERK